MINQFAEPPGTPILCGVVGSTAQGLATDCSDEDRAGVFMVPPRELLGLGGRDADSFATTNPDSTWHPLRKFLILALQCNPGALELLWINGFTLIAPAGAAVLDLRSAVLSTDAARGAYLGYAEAQLARYRKMRTARPDKAQKPLRHAFRLLDQGGRLLATGRVEVQVEDRAWFLDVLPLMSVEQAEREAAARLARLANAPSTLPDIPDRERVNDTLIRLRAAHIAAGLRA